jgi:Family of unknown function (DUF6220)
MGQARILYFGLAALYLAAVIVQFFLAGLGVFQATDYDAHSVLGFIIGIGSLALLVVAVIARLPRLMVGLTVLLVGLNVLQFVLPNIDTGEIAALHPVNGVAIVFLAHVLVQRSRRFLAERIQA